MGDILPAPERVCPVGPGSCKLSGPCTYCGSLDETAPIVLGLGTCDLQLVELFVKELGPCWRKYVPVSGL